MARKSGPERREHGSDRRKQILAIAAKLFATHGYSSTTVRDIADEAGILSGSLYHHFASKEAIAREVLLTFLESLVAQYEEIVAADDDVRTTVENLVRVSFAAIQDQTDSVGLYQNEALFLQTQPGFEFIGEKSARIEAIWLEQLRRGQDQGSLRETLDLPTLYRFIRDSLWSSVRWYHPGGRHTADTLSATFLDLIRHGILAD
ncbi:TetR family transcriptional regulator [Leucobacter luti]|uniref:TetR family transcriptional regulator n=1 Tax=Leucobacter luti TaxID=340320 RepID=UPI003CFCE326